MRLSVDKASAVPPYEQLRIRLAEQIHSRELPVGARLPTVRQLAADLDLATNTVARAYRELELAGLVETHGRGGTFVGAGSSTAREQARSAAAEYAATVNKLGLALDESLSIVRAALEAAHPR